MRLRGLSLFQSYGQLYLLSVRTAPRCARGTRHSAELRRFSPDLTLTCVCKECNHYFGAKLEWLMLIESVEGLRRLQFGLKGKVGGIRTRGVQPVIGEGDDW